MKYFLILFAAVILSSFTATAQNNRLPGQIETNNGQVIEGFIVFKDKSATPQEIEFVKPEVGERQIFRASDLLSYEIDGRRFISRIVDIDKTPSGLNKQDYLKQKHQIRDTVFLSVEVQSAISLYYFREADHRDHFYIQVDGGELMELIKHEYFDEVMEPMSNEPVPKLVTSNKYRNQLGYAFSACPEVGNKVRNMSFKLPDMRKLVLAYNECNGQEVNYKKENEKVEFKFGIVAGVASQSLTFRTRSDIFKDMEKAEMDPSVNPVFGGSMDIIFSKNHKRWSLNNLLLVAPFEYESFVHVPTVIPEIYDNFDFSFSGTYIKLLPKLRYSFSNSKVSPFVNVGISVAYLAGFKSERKREIVTYDIVRQTEAIAIPNPSSFEKGLEAGAGLKFGNKLSVEYCYEMSDGMSGYQDLVSNFNRHYLIVSYLF